MAVRGRGWLLASLLLAALDEALGCGRPALIELRVDPQAITPRQTIDEIRAAAEAMQVPVFANGILIHMFGVGLPASLIARAAARGSAIAA